MTFSISLLFFFLPAAAIPSLNLHLNPKKEKRQRVREGNHVRLQQSDFSNAIPSNTYSDGSHC